MNAGVSLFSSWLKSMQEMVRLSFFMASPAAMPHQPRVLLINLFLYLCIGFLLLGDILPFINIALQIFLELILLTTISALILKLVAKPERLLQTVSALLAVNLFTSVASYLVMSMFPDTEITESSLLITINLILLFWNLAVISLIFRKAFELSVLLSGFIAFNYFVVYQYLIFHLLQA